MRLLSVLHDNMEKISLNKEINLDKSNYDRYVKAVSLEGINAKNKPIS